MHTLYAASPAPGCTPPDYSMKLHTQYAALLAPGCTPLAYDLENAHTHMRHQVVRFLHTIWKCTHTVCGIRLHASCIQFGNAQTHTVCGIRLHASCIQFRNAQTQTVCGIRMCASCIQFRNAQTVYFWSTTTPEQGTTPSLNDHPAQTTTHNLYDNSEHYWLPSALMSIHRLNDHEEYPQY